MKKTVLITGASKGIGSSIASVFSKNEYNVVINYLNSEKEAFILRSFLNEKGGTVKAYQADVSKREQVIGMVEFSRKEFGAIDVLVNNAGISSQKLFTEIEEAEWDFMMDVNVKGMFNACQCVVPHMIQRKQGKIINISSIWGLVGASCEVHYSASKAAMIGFTKALAKELGPSNIQVNCVAPGMIDTGMNDFLDDKELKNLKVQTPLNRIGNPSDVSSLVLFLASPEAEFMTGQVISPNGGFVI
jgi:3-oxoacyl-[acyl-carrier protein] reductase